MVTCLLYGGRNVHPILLLSQIRFFLRFLSLKAKCSGFAQKLILLSYAELYERQSNKLSGINSRRESRGKLNPVTLVATSWNFEIVMSRLIFFLEAMSTACPANSGFVEANSSLSLNIDFFFFVSRKLCVMFNTAIFNTQMHEVKKCLNRLVD